METHEIVALVLAVSGASMLLAAPLGYYTGRRDERRERAERGESDWHDGWHAGYADRDHGLATRSTAPTPGVRP